MASDVSLIILSAGDSTRFGQNPKKQWIAVGDEPLWLYVAKRFQKIYNFDKIVITSSKEEMDYKKNFSQDFDIVCGGDTRQNSIQNAIKKIETKYVMISDMARCCVPKKVVLNLLKHRTDAVCVVPTLGISDTLKYENSYIDREKTYLIQTPQISITSKLIQAISKEKQYTDESTAIKADGGTVLYIKGSKKSDKITTKKDIKNKKCLKAQSKKTLVGFGYDIHKIIDDKPMYLCGIKLDTKYGLLAHSDGDVAIHSVIDAIVGAMGAGDIGDFFPDTHIQYENISSAKLLQHIARFATKTGYKIVNIDMTIVAQIPKISPYKSQMRHHMAKLLSTKPNRINIKATTNELLDSVGQSEAIAVYAVVNLRYTKVC